MSLLTVPLNATTLVMLGRVHEEAMERKGNCEVLSIKESSVEDDL